MKKIIVFLLILNFLYSGIIEDFKNKNYQKLCLYKNIVKFENNEKILSIIGISCLKIDKLYVLPTIINRLRKTKEGLNNAIYFLTIYSQKKLLYAYLFKNFDISSFSLPLTDYVVSIVFNAIKNNNFSKKNGKFYIKIDDKVYILYKEKSKMMIDELKNNKLIKRHWYR